MSTESNDLNKAVKEHITNRLRELALACAAGEINPAAMAFQAFSLGRQIGRAERRPQHESAQHAESNASIEI